MTKPLESDAEHQRRKVMSQDERSMGARDAVARAIHNQNMKDGKNTTYDQAQKQATDLANRVYRQEQEKR